MVCSPPCASSAASTLLLIARMRLALQVCFVICLHKQCCCHQVSKASTHAATLTLGRGACMLFTGERLHMVRRWSARATVDWRIASRMVDLHRRVNGTPVLQAS